MAAVLLIAVVGYETYKPAVQEYSKPVRQSHEMVAPAAVDQSMRAPDTAKMQKVTPSESQVADQVQEEEKTEAAKPQVVKEAEPKPSEKIVGQEVVNTSQERKGKAEDKYKGSSTALSIPKEESSQTAVQQVAVSEPEKSAKIKAEVAPRAAMPVAQFNEVLKIDLDSLALSVKGGRVNELAYDVVQVAKAPEDSLGGQLAGGIVHSEAEFDSLINEYTLRATAQGDSLATETAYQRAVQYKTPDYIDVARRMLEKQLKKVEGDKLRDHYAKMLESLSDL
jgi:hypothetical protein